LFLESFAEEIGQGWPGGFGEAKAVVEEVSFSVVGVAAIGAAA
jgi:hypothetical protein